MQRILFVCTGNTCRSPMAEAILKNKKIDGLEVKSTGVYAVNGSDASRNAKMVLAENEIHHEHQSSLLTKAEIEWATVILTMTEAHKEVIIHNFPDATEKSFTLKEFIGERQQQDVIDPFGGDIQMYRDTYVELEKLIELAISRLKNNSK